MGIDEPNGSLAHSLSVIPVHDHTILGAKT